MWSSHDGMRAISNNIALTRLKYKSKKEEQAGAELCKAHHSLSLELAILLLGYSTELTKTA